MNTYSRFRYLLMPNQTKPIRVLCVFSALDRGGMESMCMRIYRNIDRTKVQFDFVKHMRKECAFEEEINKLGGKIYIAPRYRVYNHLSYCKWWKRFFASHPEYAIIHGHFFTIADIYLREAKKAGLLTISHAHNTKVNGKGLVGLVKTFIAKKAGNHADLRLACSTAAGEWLYRGKTFHIIKNALDLDEYIFNAQTRDEVRDEFNLHGFFVYGTVGRLAPGKNPNDLIRIIEKTRDRRKNIRFLWVGDGYLLKKVKNEIHKHHLEDVVILLGQRDDVNRIIQAMDAFVFPSIFEGLPLAVVEAQTSGLRCFLSDTITREVDISGLCTFLPLSNLDTWAEKLTCATGKRVDATEKLKKSGYDINTAASLIQELYIKLSSGIMPENSFYEGN